MISIQSYFFPLLVDTPDPYVQLKMKTAAETKKRTKAVDNDKNPVWNEKFTFFMDIKERNILGRWYCISRDTFIF